MKHLFLLTLVGVLTCGVTCAQDAPKPPPKQAQQDDANKKKPATKNPTADWHTDELCRMIFFTVLEGLYRDGPPDEVVDLIVGEAAKGKKKIKHNFVFRCKLCHAVFEAFRAYQARPKRFTGSEANSFGRMKVDPKVLADLKNDKDTYARVHAMGKFVQPWIKKKLLAMDPESDEAKRTLQALVKLAQEGADLTHELRRTDPAYGDWDFYGACQACQAIEDVSREGLEGAGKKD